jgi:hypothetical protein
LPPTSRRRRTPWTRRRSKAKQRAAALDEARADWDKELKALKSLLP